MGASTVFGHVTLSSIDCEVRDILGPSVPESAGELVALPRGAIGLRVLSPPTRHTLTPARESASLQLFAELAHALPLACVRGFPNGVGERAFDRVAIAPLPPGLPHGRLVAGQLGASRSQFFGQPSIRLPRSRT